MSPDDTTAYLQRAVNWEPGQQVLLTTTALKDARDYHRNEVLVLSSLLTPPPTSLSTLDMSGSSCAPKAARLIGEGLRESHAPSVGPV